MKVDKIGGASIMNGEMRNAYKIWSQNLNIRDILENLSTDGMILIWILWEQDRSCGLDSTRSGWSPTAGYCEHGNGPKGHLVCQSVIFIIHNSSTVFDCPCLHRRIHKILKPIIYYHLFKMHIQNMVHCSMGCCCPLLLQS